jgi:uncharacterized protein Smg (DUF494 family)
MSYPLITFQNQLNIPVIVYDSFNNEDQNNSLANYFGTLTPIGTPLAAGASVSIQPIHGPISVYIIYDTNNNPIKRVTTLGNAAASFQITQADVDIITLTKNFIDFLKNSPNDPVATSFNALIKDGKAKPSQINAFFSSSANYKTCTNVSYMLVMIELSKTASSNGKPLPEATYSLSTLISYLGVEWPSFLPDISVSNFTCSDDNDQLKLACDIDLHNITFADGVLNNVLSFLPSSNIRTKIIFNYGASLSFLNTTLEFDLEDIKIPLGSETVSIDKPTIILSITPLFKFVVFEVKAIMPFSLFGSPSFNADIAMTIDNVEAEVGVVLEGNNNSLLTPPIMKGVHFDSIGVGMGLIFDPPSFALGVQGAFHIGNAGDVKLDDDNFIVVCSLVEDVPNPLYISFYVPQMNLSDVITIFTNSSNNIDFPISISDLSFTWIENPMEPVTLPDGSLAAMAYGFSGNLNLFGLDFYGNVAIDLSNGLTGNVTMSPFNFGPLSLTGNGKGVSIKVDANGNPIKNNFIPKTAADKLAVQNASTKELVAAGGPSMTISTSGSPYFSLGASLKFLDFNDSIAATIDKNGITFDLELLTTKMNCCLKDYQNFSGSFSFGPDFTIKIPEIAGFNIGSIHFQATINANLGIAVSSGLVAMSVGGGFNIFGLSLNVGTVELDIHTSSINYIFNAIEQWIISNATSLFGSLFSDAKAWLNAIENSIIQPLENDVKYITSGLSTAYNQVMNDATLLLKDANYAINDITSAIQSVYNASQDAIASALNYAGFAVNDIGSALKYVGYGANEIAGALKSAGYSINDVANTLNNMGYGLQVVAGALNIAGYGVQAVASALSTVFNAAPEVLNTVLQQAGYAVNDINQAFQAIGGPFASFVSNAAQAAAAAVAAAAEAAAKAAEEAAEEAAEKLNPTHW